jgi:hypothetical protein
MKQELETASKTDNSRRKLVKGMGLLTLIPLFKFSLFKRRVDVISCAPEKSGTMRMLTEDGKLVEVDISKISSNRQKASSKEVMGWIKKK